MQSKNGLTGGNFAGTGVAPAREKQGEDSEREARIADIRERYRTGTYKIDARATAAAIVKQHPELLKRG